METDDDYTDMDIYSPEGTKIIFTANGGMKGEVEHATKILKIGDVYTVRGTIIHSFSTEVYLEEFPDISFNSCLFENYNTDNEAIGMARKCPKCKKKLMKVQELIEQQDMMDSGDHWVDVGYMCKKCKEFFKDKTVMVKM